MIKPIIYKQGEIIGEYGVKYICELESLFDKRGSRIRRAAFLCTCGNEFIARMGHVKEGSTKSCGCRQRNDYTGSKYGRLTVLNFVKSKRIINSRNYIVIWRCICDCGNIIEVNINNVVNDRTSSCGCLKSEHVKRNLSKLASKKGKSHHNYNHNLSDEERGARQIKDQEYHRIRKLVYKRDGFTCQKCGYKGNNLNAHHIESWNSNKEKRYDPDNLVTLCQQCHNLFHTKYGRGNNTINQYANFEL